MKSLNIEDFEAHSFIVIFGDDDEPIKRVVQTQTPSMTTVIDDKENPFWTKDTAIQQIAQRGRYNKTSLVIHLSEPKELPTHIKYYIDYAIVPQQLYRDCVDCAEKRRLVWKAYGQCIPSYENFMNILDRHSIVITNGQAFVCVI
jgi:hypothetical protein